MKIKIKSTVVTIAMLACLFCMTGTAVVSRCYADDAPAGPLPPSSNEVSHQYDSYKFAPDDIIKIYVDQHPEWSGEIMIRPDGKVFMPGIGELQAAGLSREGFRDEYTNALKRFVNNPQVTIDIVKFANQAIYVLGQVNNPGKYLTDGKILTVRDAVVMAGLPARLASTSRVFVITPSQTGRAAQKVVDLDRILNYGELQNNVELKPGDIVYVPPTLLGRVSNFISGLFQPFTNGGSGIPSLPTVP